MDGKTANAVGGGAGRRAGAGADADADHSNAGDRDVDGLGMADVKRETLLGISSEHRLRSENLPFDIDVWYPRLAKHTYPTVFLPLRRAEAEACMRYYQTRYNIRPNSLTPAHVDVLEALERRVDAALAAEPAFRGPDGAPRAFVRLCGRSPKDGEPVHRERVMRQYQAVLDGLEAEGHDRAAGATRLMAVARVSWLCVTSGAEVMSLLLTSERVYADLHDWLRWGEPEQLCLRAWDERMRYDYEFRVFVSRGRVTAISQYDHYAVYPHLQAPGMVGRIRRALLRAWEAVHESVGQDSYCADFCFVPGDGSGASAGRSTAGAAHAAADAGTAVAGASSAAARGTSGGPADSGRAAATEGAPDASGDEYGDSATLIELSPFLPCTGPALFHWKLDRAVLHEGPLEVRLKVTPHPDVDDVVDTLWEGRWTTPQPHYRRLYDTARARVTAVESTPVRRAAEATRRSASQGGLAAATIAAAALAAALAAAVVSAYGSSHACGPWIGEMLGTSAWLAGGGGAVGVDVDPGATATTCAIAVAVAAGVSTAGALLLASLALLRSRKSAVPVIRESHPARAGGDHPRAADSGAAAAAASHHPRGKSTLLFVYGTLKRGMHWHHKFLGADVFADSGAAVFEGEAVTIERHPLVVGACGVPYLLGDLPEGTGERVRGELWRVDAATLSGLDDYEGVTKGYYARRTISVRITPKPRGAHEASGSADADATAAERDIVRADVYFKTESDSCPELRTGPFRDEYTLEFHREHYRATEHIQAKQQRYLQVEGAAQRT